MDNNKENIANGPANAENTIVIRYTREELLQHLHDSELAAPNFSAKNNPNCLLSPVLLRHMTHFMEFQLTSGKSVTPLETLQPLPLVHASIVEHLEYYFSMENLTRDGYLKANARVGRHFDGWVLVEDLLRYQRMRALTMHPKTIAEAAKYSNSAVIEYDKVKGKIRRRPSNDDEGGDDRIA